MTRFIFGMLLVVAIGCTNIEPVGVLKKGPPSGSKGKDARDKDRESDAEPVSVPAVKPTPPMNLVDPSEVSVGDPYAAAQKLMSEIEADRKSASTAPQTVEVSRIKNGVKQN